MATFLLDTQAVVWFNLSDARLTAAARQVIVDPGNRIWISPASYWEIAIKISRGKFSVVGPRTTHFGRRRSTATDSRSCRSRSAMPPG